MTTNKPIFNLNDLLRPDIRNMSTYTPILPFEALSAQLDIPIDQIIKLDANENPYGSSPLIRQALVEAPYLHIYPDPQSRDLRKALSDYTEISDDHLMVGHGADELIDLLMRLFITSGDGVINCPPTFGMYAFDADVNGATCIDVPRQADFSLNLAALEKAVQQHQVKIIFITSPNNPDGSIISNDTLTALLNLPVLIVLDEAYIEFGGHSFISWVKSYPNLVILRTFSKWAGLAGLRIGYAAIPLKIIEHLWKIKQPYNVNVAGQLAALASLQDMNYLQENINKIIATREQFWQDLQTISWLQPYPSHSNFILCKVLEQDALEIKTRLAQKGILVRYYNTSGLKDHLRISIGTPEQMETVTQTLKHLT